MGLSDLRDVKVCATHAGACIVRCSANDLHDVRLIALTIAVLGKQQAPALRSDRGNKERVTHEGRPDPFR